MTPLSFGFPICETGMILILMTLLQELNEIRSENYRLIVSVQYMPVYFSVASSCFHGTRARKGSQISFDISLMFRRWNLAC